MAKTETERSAHEISLENGVKINVDKGDGSNSSNGHKEMIKTIEELYNKTKFFNPLPYLRLMYSGNGHNGNGSKVDKEKTKEEFMKTLYYAASSIIKKTVKIEDVLPVCLDKGSIILGEDHCCRKGKRYISCGDMLPMDKNGKRLCSNMDERDIDEHGLSREKQRENHFLYQLLDGGVEPYNKIRPSEIIVALLKYGFNHNNKKVYQKIN